MVVSTAHRHHERMVHYLAAIVVRQPFGPVAPGLLALGALVARWS
jgi:hypothetical protein